MDKKSSDIDRAAAAAVERFFDSKQTTAAPTKRLLDVTEAAAVLGLGRSVVYRLIMSGELVSLKIGGRRLAPVASLDSFIEERLLAEAAAAGVRA
ncbi:MAG: helix-turn-helix domain-containing protein [Chloroflexi bacterium]|nr:helix-turn-helix domain-containing protein [Chloroflexota bacterium]